MEDNVTFPTPSSDWGTVTDVSMANPAWRWWAFWRPRVLVFIKDGKPVDGPLDDSRDNRSSSGDS